MKTRVSRHGLVDPGLRAILSRVVEEVSQEFGQVATLHRNSVCFSAAVIPGQGRAAGKAPHRPNEAKCQIADTSKAKRKLRWVPRTSLEEGLRKTIDYFQSQDERSDK